MSANFYATFIFFQRECRRIVASPEYWSVSDLWPVCCEVWSLVEANFLSGVYSSRTSAEACEKSSQWLWKEKLCEKARKHVCVTDHHDMTLAVRVALNPNTTNQHFIYWHYRHMHIIFRSWFIEFSLSYCLSMKFLQVILLCIKVQFRGKELFGEGIHHLYWKL